MSQNITPVNGGRESIQVSPSAAQGIYISPQYQEANNIFSTPTEWVPGGRPIYDRLPAISERYKINFGFDQDSAYVFVPVGESVFGPNSLEVIASDDNKFLIIKRGAVVWEYGNFKVDPVIISLEEIGMLNTKYLIAYQLTFDDSPFDALYEVADYSLSGYEMTVRSGTDGVPGWRYISKYAFCGLNSIEWRNYDGLFPDYTEDAYLTWLFPKAASLTAIELRCPTNSAITGTATLHTTDCLNLDSESPYCDSPIFTEYETVAVQSDASGQYFRFEIPNSPFITGWSVSWSDKKVAIKDVKVTGTIPIRSKPAEGITNISLVAYPQSTLPATVTNGLGKEVPAVYCKLAFVDTSNAYTVTKIEDIRESVNTDYQPIADWLTRPWDENLINIFEQIQNYPELWMNPVTCMKQEYAQLSEDLIVVES